jgi:hypothetical protein
MTSRHGSPCRIASGREREESSEQEDRQAAVSVPCGRHGHNMSNCRAIHPGGRDHRGPGHIETRVSVRLTMPNDDADASAACRHVGRPVDRSMPRVVPVVHRRTEPGSPRNPTADRARGADRGDGPDSRRVGYREGAGVGRKKLKGGKANRILDIRRCPAPLSRAFLLSGVTLRTTTGWMTCAAKARL